MIMSVFTQLRVRDDPSSQVERFVVVEALPWWLPKHHHENAFMPQSDGSFLVHLRIPFYSPTRPRIGESFHPELYFPKEHTA